MLQDARQWLNSGRIADVRQARSGATALHVAAAKGYSEVLRWVHTAAGTRSALSSPPPSPSPSPSSSSLLLYPLGPGSSPPSSQASPGAPRGAGPGGPEGLLLLGGSSPSRPHHPPLPRCSTGRRASLCPLWPR